MTLPRELALDQCGRLISRPAKEYEHLRMTPYTEKDLTLNAGERLPLPVSGRQLEVVLTVHAGKGCLNWGSLRRLMKLKSLCSDAIHRRERSGWIQPGQACPTM